MMSADRERLLSSAKRLGKNSDFRLVLSHFINERLALVTGVRQDDEGTLRAVRDFHLAKDFEATIEDLVREAEHNG